MGGGGSRGVDIIDRDVDRMADAGYYGGKGQETGRKRF